MKGKPFGDLRGASDSTIQRLNDSTIFSLAPSNAEAQYSRQLQIPSLPDNASALQSSGFWLDDNLIPKTLYLPWPLGMCGADMVLQKKAAIFLVDGDGIGIPAAASTAARVL